MPAPADPDATAPPAATADPAALAALALDVKALARDLGFDACGIAGIDLPDDEAHLLAWLAAGMHGGLHYMERHGVRRARPAELRPGTLRVISVRLDYWPGTARDAQAVLDDPQAAYVSRYALGRDYHKLMRNRLQRLADRLIERIGEFGHRVYVDSGPVLEKALARGAGLGWIGKHTNLIDARNGSWFFLGELYTDLALPIDGETSAHCGSCQACLPACPTGAIVAPWRLDARRCISYLTIEHAGSIDPALRPLMGNRIYGCDDCQLACPWNRYARPTREPGFEPRDGLDAARLVDLFAWSAEEFDARTRGTAIRRIGHERWLRNIAIALGNGPATPEAEAALAARALDASEVVREHVEWARAALAARAAGVRA